MNELRVDIGGSTRGFQVATEQTKRMAKDLQRSMEGYTPQSWKGMQAAKDKYASLFKEMGGGEGGGVLKNVAGLFGETGESVLEMAGKFGKAAGIIGIFAGGIHSAYEAMKSAFELQREASNLGVSATFLKGFNRAAEEQGVDDAGSKLYRLTDKVGSAAEGDKESRDLLAGMGVSVGGKTMEQVILDVAKAFEEIKDPAERAHKAVQLFGRGGQAVLPVLKELSEMKGQSGGLATQALREGAQKGILANMISVDDEEIAIEAKAYKAIKQGLAAPFRLLKGAWNHAVASVAGGVFGVKADAPEQNRIVEQESPEDVKARQEAEKEAQRKAEEQAKERIRLQKEYHDELEHTVSLADRLAMLQKDINQADTDRYAAQRSGDYNAYLAAQIELMRKRKEYEDTAKEIGRQKQGQMATKEMFHVDSLGSMGGFVAAAMVSNQSLDVARKQLAKLDLIAKNTGPRPNIYEQ